MWAVNRPREFAKQMGIVFLGLVLFVLSFVVGAASKQMPGQNFGGLAWIARIIGILMVVGGVMWAMVVQIPAGYRGVLLRFGAVQGQLSEGIHLIVPGINSYVPMEVRTQKEESQATAASRDLQVVTTSLALNFRVDPEHVSDLYRNVGTDYKSRVIDPTVQESVKVVTARYAAEELIRKRAQVKSEVEEEISKRLRAFNIVVDPTGLSITNFDFSPEFNKAIEQKQVAQQEAEKQRYVLQQALLEQQTQVARAEGSAKAARLNAGALQVQGGAMLIAREWIEKWDGKLPSVSTSGGGSGGGGFIIDLNSLLKAAP